MQDQAILPVVDLMMVLCSARGSLEELQRLAALHALGLLDTEPEPEFDEVVELAAAICEAPIGLMSLVDAERVYHKARLGIAMKEAPRDLSICQHTVQQDDVMVVEDTHEDERFRETGSVPGGRDAVLCGCAAAGSGRRAHRVAVRGGYEAAHP